MRKVVHTSKLIVLSQNMAEMNMNWVKRADPTQNPSCFLSHSIGRSLMRMSVAYNRQSIDTRHRIMVPNSLCLFLTKMWAKRMQRKMSEITNRMGIIVRSTFLRHLRNPSLSSGGHTAILVAFSQRQNSPNEYSVPPAVAEPFWKSRLNSS